MLAYILSRLSLFWVYLCLALTEGCVWTLFRNGQGKGKRTSEQREYVVNITLISDISFQEMSKLFLIKNKLMVSN